VQFVPGYFEQTLAGLAGHRWAIVRLDADSYEATRLALECLYPGLGTGGYLIVDDYGSFDACRRAVDDFRAEHGIAEPITAIDHTGARWRRESATPIEVSPPSPAAPPGAPKRPRQAHVPTGRELELAAQIEELRARLDAAQAQIGLRAWVRRRLGR
jgi:hypothetical protein